MFLFFIFYFKKLTWITYTKFKIVDIGIVDYTDINLKYCKPVWNLDYAICISFMYLESGRFFEVFKYINFSYNQRLLADFSIQKKEKNSKN